MPESTASSLSAERLQPGQLGVLATAFLLSGISGLVYEIVWLRMLIRAFGVTIYAVSTILMVFMAGLALGGFVGGHLARRTTRPMRWYAGLEAGIGALALITTALTGTLPVAFVWGSEVLGGGPNAVAALRLLLALVVLLPPTFLMGATLPLLSGFVTSRGYRVGRGVGLLYGINTLGAVVGVVLAGFLFLDVLGEWRSCVLAASLNLGVAVLVTLAFRTSEVGPPSPARREPVRSEHRDLILLYAASGFCALGYQVVWSRLLIVLLGSSVYGFSSMLAVYLLGLGLGGLLMARWSDRIQRPLRAFALLQLAVAVCGLLSLATFAAVGASETRPEYLYSALWSSRDLPPIFLNALLIVFPATLALGALFPLISRLCVGAPEDTAPVVGRIYGWNTVGAIGGAFVSGFLLLPALGTQASFFLLAAISLGICCCCLWLSERREGRLPLQPALALAVVAFLGAGSFAARDPFLHVFRARLGPGDVVLHHREDKAATVTVVRTGQGVRQLYVNGRNVSAALFGGRLLMHFPSLYHPAPQKTLTIGLGAGEAFRASLDQGCETTVVELVEEVVACFPLFAQDQASRYLGDARARVVVNDGRNHLLRSRERYDVVLVDGSPPIFASGTVNLYSLEFVRLVEARLTEQGIFALWLPGLFESDFWMIARNFADTFAHFTALAPQGWSGCFLLGTRSKVDPFGVTKEGLRRRIAERQWPGLVPAWGDVLAESVVGSEAELRARLAGYPAITDDRPYTEFPLLRFLSGRTFHTMPREFLVRTR